MSDAAVREVEEEVGLYLPDQQLCGVISIDIDDSAGIGLFVFVVETDRTPTASSKEGEPIWIDLESLAGVEIVDDLPELIPQAIEAYRQGELFFGSYTYGEDDTLQIRFG